MNETPFDKLRANGITYLNFTFKNTILFTEMILRKTAYNRALHMSQYLVDFWRNGIFIGMNK
jgi:hypothetical protein